jgi:NAD(P)H-hydrate epimerase
MQIVLTPARMREVDEHCIRALRIPGLVLMENAGRGIADCIEDEWGSVEGKRIVVVAGKGNNGGDGFVAARQLVSRGAHVHVSLVGKPVEVKGDARINMTAYFQIVKVSRADGTASFSAGISANSAKRGIPNIIVDALFGTGFAGVPAGNFKRAIEWMNSTKAKIISADIPSGINGESGVAAGVAVKADVTATMGYLKTGFFANDALECCGRIRVVELGAPKIAPSHTNGDNFLVEVRDVRAALPLRKPNSNKYTFDRVLILAGSRGFTGAAAMTSQAAMKAGAGTVVLVTPRSVYPILARKLTEVMVTPLPETPHGTLSLSAYEELLPLLKKAGLLILGPGLSQNRETQELLYKILKIYRGKLLLDADALNAVAAHPASFRLRVSKETILTPHVGEFSRLTGKTSKAIELNRFESARIFARKSNCTVVLKGAHTLTAGTDGVVHINSTGNPAMATAGSGDVLTGILAGLWSQGMTASSAAWASVFLHGRASDLASRRSGARSLVATEIISHLPQAFGSIVDKS